MLEFEKDSQVGLVCTNAMNFDKDGEHGARIKANLKDFGDSPAPVSPLSSSEAGASQTLVPLPGMFSIN